MTTRLIPLSLIVAALLAACTAEAVDPPEGGDSGSSGTGGSDSGSPTTATGTMPEDVDLDDHGQPHDLGKATVGTWQLQVTQYGAVNPGAELAFDVELAKDATMPPALYGWIGTEDGKGSRKAKLSRAGDTTLHGHAEVPSPLPEGAAFWLEIELDAGPSRGSIALHQ